MPFVVYLLALAVFAQGTSEFMLSGLLPGIARDLQVSIPATGLLTSAFAAGMVVGAPLMAVLSLRWSRRRALLAFLVMFLAAHVAGAVTTSYGVLLGTRVVAALANAGFLAVAMATAVALAPPNAKGRATSVLLAGVTIACVAGVPGELWGWRSAFWAVAVALVPAIIAVPRAVPREHPATALIPTGTAPAAASVGEGAGVSGGAGVGGVDGGATSSVGGGARGELRALRTPRLLVLLLLGALVNGATFCAFTYLAPLLTGDTGIDPSWMPLMLALFGLGSFAGVSAGGRLADARPVPLLVVGGVALAAGWAAFALTAGAPVPAVALVFVQGALSFAVGSTLVSQVLYAATGAPTLAGASATAALNGGATLGPWLGGTAIDAGLGLRSPLWVSALLVTAALVTAATRAVLVKAGPVRTP